MIVVVLLLLLYGGWERGSVLVDADGGVDCSMYQSCLDCVGTWKRPGQCEWTVGNDGSPGQCLMDHRDFDGAVQYFIKPGDHCFSPTTEEPEVLAPDSVKALPPSYSSYAGTFIGYTVLGMVFLAVVEVAVLVVRKLCALSQPVEQPSELHRELEEILAASDRGEHLNPNRRQQLADDYLLIARTTRRPVSEVVQVGEQLADEGLIPPPVPPRQPSMVREENALLSVTCPDEEEHDNLSILIPEDEQDTEVLPNLSTFERTLLVPRKRQGSIVQTLKSAASFGEPPAEEKRNASRPRPNYRV